MCLPTLALVAYPLLTAQPGQGLLFSTRAVWTRAPYATEIPFDLDADGEDEVLLLSDRLRGGDGVTYLQVLSQGGDLIAGPYLPGADVQDLCVLDVDADSRPELVISTENPYAVHIVQSDLDSATVHPLGRTSEEGLSVRILGALEGAGAPREVLIAITPRAQPGVTRLEAIQWTEHRLVWSMELPGVLTGDAVWWHAGGQGLVAIPWSSPSATGVWVVDSSGKLVRQIQLAEVPAEARAAVVDVPVGSPLLLTFVGGKGGAELATWADEGARLVSTASLQGARPPVLPCALHGSRHVAVATEAGEVLILDLALREVVRFKLADRPATLLQVADLDQDGSSDLVCRAGAGIGCVHLSSGAHRFWDGATSAHVLRTGFGRDPVLVLRAGEYCSSHALLGTVTERKDVRIPSHVAAGATLALLGVGAACGRALHCGWVVRVHRRIFQATDAPAGVVRRSSLVWANASLLANLRQPALRGTRPVSAVLRAAGFCPAEGCGRDARVIAVGADRSFKVSRVPLCRDALLRPYGIVAMEETTRRASENLADVWAVAAGELTAQIRTSLSAIRLASQWVLSHGGSGAERAQRLELVLTQARVLRGLADRLSEAAHVVDAPWEEVDLTEVAREVVAARAGGQVEVLEGEAVVVRARKRQVALALDVVLGEILRRSDGANVRVSAGCVRLGAGTGNGRCLSITCTPRPGMEAPSLSRFAAALAEAVVASHGGAFHARSSDGGLTVRLAFPES